ncbi:hypothetical protein BH721_03650 [Clostridium baratii]|uniref:hypothetical protein n=1 Tax=Clostridium baratii TaxID=1561 RepID=UPI0009A4388D|nr:hypothetical protein [Clostridium baratii]OPF52360.1 hypothetical protein A1M12_09855 [Clostridium baratii]OPF55810.1 hypothetical protein BH721_03650 [Clostridium baratii]OPF56810.1 hypothetical protein BH724_09775 [Clostridium baratii]OPF59809.1 hypothetical protein BH725_04275 [Clostridium baratii]
MKKNHSKSTNLITKLLYTVSIIIGIYALLSIYNSYTYISSLVESNRLVIKDALLSVITYYCNASIPYIFYSIATFALGYVIDKLSSRNESEEYKKIYLQDCNENEEEDLDEFIEEVKTYQKS